MTNYNILAGRFQDTLNIADASVDLVLSDPPYGNNYGHTRQKFRGFSVEGDDMLYLDEFFQLCLAVTRPGAPVLLFADHKGFSKTEAAAARSGFRLVSTAVWDKMHFGIGYSFRPRHEFIMLFSTAKSVMARTKNLPSVLQCPRVLGAKKEHPTQKPLALLDTLVRNFSDPMDLVLDPFMGSGSTGVAAVAAGRRFIGSELEPAFFQIAHRRLAEAALA